MAAVDRLVHNAHILEFDNARLRASRGQETHRRLNPSTPQAKSWVLEWGDGAVRRTSRNGATQIATTSLCADGGFMRFLFYRGGSQEYQAIKLRELGILGSDNSPS